MLRGSGFGVCGLVFRVFFFFFPGLGLSGESTYEGLG